MVIDFLSSLGPKIILEIRLCWLFSFKIYAFKFINRDFLKRKVNVSECRNNYRVLTIYQKLLISLKAMKHSHLSDESYQTSLFMSSRTVHQVSGNLLRRGILDSKNSAYKFAHFSKGKSDMWSPDWMFCMWRYVCHYLIKFWGQTFCIITEIFFKDRIQNI